MDKETEKAMKKDNILHLTLEKIKKSSGSLSRTGLADFAQKSLSSLGVLNLKSLKK